VNLFQEPWRVRDDETFLELLDDEGEVFAECPIDEFKDKYQEPIRLKFARAVECVNACVGIDNPRKMIKNNGHDIRVISEGPYEGLTVCDRCNGGEGDLDTPCAERLRSTLNAFHQLKEEDV
jgi:hypothetical protein